MRSAHPQIQYIKVAKLPARDTAVWWVRTVRNMSASLSSLVLLLSLSYFRASGSGFHWDYSLSGTNGPQYWKNHYPSCGMTKQSPIDLVEKVAQHDDDLSPILFRNYDTQLSVTMELLNNGHTAEVKLTQGALSISGGHLGHDYVALQFHFHWGSSSDRGSEHHLNGKASPMELHIVHRNKKYNNTEMALKDVEGLAVLGFFFNVVQTRNTKLDVIINHLKEIRFNGNKTNITAFPLMDILPDESNLKDYFRYDGSLTTPPCSQAVIWTVFRTPIEISEKQLVELRSLKSGTSSSSKSISNNYRPIQRLEMRDLKTSFKPLGTESKAPSIVSFLVVVLLCATSSALAY